MEAIWDWGDTMVKKLPLKSFRLKNFKAIRDSGDVKFTPLTVLIGDNGSGKSSLVEGLETYQRIVTQSLDSAMGMWRGLEHVAHPPFGNGSTEMHFRREYSAIGFDVRGHSRQKAYKSTMTLGFNGSRRGAFIDDEKFFVGRAKVLERDHAGTLSAFAGHKLHAAVSKEKSVIAPWIFVGEESTELSNDVFSFFRMIHNWQFVRLNPSSMGHPFELPHTEHYRILETSGSNIAQYLRDIRNHDAEAFLGIVEALRFVIPYAKDLKPTLVSDLDRSIYLQMSEENFEVPGWMLSTGTLRVLALLALFRHPDPPSLIVIEEIENGLDPRSVHLIVEEIRDVVESGRSQVILTTHSPYLLDLLPLSSIVLVERVEGQPTFSRPADDNSLKGWSKKFAPGKLYTMGNLNSQKTL